MLQGHALGGMLHRLLDQVGQLQGPGGLQPIHRRGLAATDALEEVLQFSVEGSIDVVITSSMKPSLR